MKTEKYSLRKLANEWTDKNDQAVDCQPYIDIVNDFIDWLEESGYELQGGFIRRTKTTGEGI